MARWQRFRYRRTSSTWSRPKSEYCHISFSCIVQRMVPLAPYPQLLLAGSLSHEKFGLQCLFSIWSCPWWREDMACAIRICSVLSGWNTSVNQYHACKLSWSSIWWFGYSLPVSRPQLKRQMHIDYVGIGERTSACQIYK